MHDDPPEPTKEEVEEGEARLEARSKPIHIEGLTVAHVEHALRGIIDSHYGISERAEERLDKAIDRVVSKLVTARLEARLDAAIDAALANGFPVFDRWNGKETSRTSVAELVQKALSDNVEEGYNKPRKTRAQIAVEHAVAKLFDDELKAELEKVRKDLRQQADDVFKAKLVTTMKEALGLRA